MKFFISTGEVSGDLHMSYLIKAMLAQSKDITFYGVIGNHSKDAGAQMVQDIRELSIMGFTGILKKYRFLKKKAHEYINFIIRENIENVILVDYGGFNLKFLKLLKEKVPHVKVYYYIPPKLWIWGAKRVETLRLADHIMVIFPWEVDFYKKYGIDAVYFGNPLTERYKKIKRVEEYVLLLPGSRKQEIKTLFPILLKVVGKRKNQNFLLKLSSSDHLNWIEEDLSQYPNLKVTWGSALEKAVEESSVAIAASGTVTLELALLGIPTVVVYKTNLINEFIAKYILKVGLVSLPNITLNKEIYPELLQRKCNPIDIERAMDRVKRREKEIEKDLDRVRSKLSGDEIVQKYAEFILKGN
jgi:lipid-A-disaccharide synthase